MLRSSDSLIPRLVNDFAEMLNSGEISSLENKLAAFNDSISTQITATVKDLKDMISRLYKVGRAWGIGQRG